MKKYTIAIWFILARIIRELLAKVLNHGLEVNKFKLQSRYFPSFSTNTLGKSENTFIRL